MFVNAKYKWSGNRGCQSGGASPSVSGLRELEVGIGLRVQEPTARSATVELPIEQAEGDDVRGQHEGRTH